MKRNPAASVYALSFIGSVGVLIINLQPLFVGSAAQTFGFDAVRLGALMSGAAFASFLVFLTASFWRRLYSARVFIYGGSICSVLALLVMMWAQTLPTLIALFMIYAVGAAVLQVAVMVALGRMPDIEAAFGVYIAATVILAGSYAILIPTFIEPRLGFDGVLALIVVTTVVALASMRFIPETVLLSNEKSELKLSAFKLSLRARLALAALAIFYLGVMGVWSFLERLATKSGLSAEAIGGSFAAALLLSGAGPLVTAYFGDRLSVRAAIAATAALFAAFIALLWGDTGFVRFALAVIFFNIGWAFSVPYFFSVIGGADPSEEGLALSPAGIALGAAVGPVVGGSILSAFGAAALMSLFCLTLAVSFSILVRVDAKERAGGARRFEVR